MRDDIKYLIENTTNWKENFAEDPVEIKQVLPASASIAAWRKKDPHQVDLFAAYIIAANEGDTATADAVMELINQHKKD